MKFLRFLFQDQVRLGILRENTIRFSEDPRWPRSLEDLLVDPDRQEALVNSLKGMSVSQVDIADVQILAPITRPGKIVAIGLNYLDHCREQNIPAPLKPIVFTKFPSAIIGPEEPIRWDPDLTSQVDYEIELGVIIGQAARNVSEANALDYVFGYTIINDVSARDLQFSDQQWVRAKSLDTFCPVGPLVVSADEIPDPQALSLRTVLNGRVVQDSSTAEMVFGVARLISELSHSFTFHPGDLIATGTPDGVGVFRKPQIFLQDGDQLQLQIEKIGTLRNTVRL